MASGVVVYSLIVVAVSTMQKGNLYIVSWCCSSDFETTTTKFKKIYFILYKGGHRRAVPSVAMYNSAADEECY